MSAAGGRPACCCSPRLHPLLINYFGRELDLDDPRYQKCHCCHCPTKYSNLVVLG